LNIKDGSADEMYCVHIPAHDFMISYWT